MRCRFSGTLARLRVLTRLDTRLCLQEYRGMTAAIDTAVEAFREALIAEGGLDGVQVSDADEVGRRAAALVRGATAWREHLGELLNVGDVMALLEVTTRQAVYDLVKRRRLIGLRRDGGSMAF